jgi:hypothetical protein
MSQSQTGPPRLCKIAIEQQVLSCANAESQSQTGPPRLCKCQLPSLPNSVYSVAIPDGTPSPLQERDFLISISGIRLSQSQTGPPRLCKIEDFSPGSGVKMSQSQTGPPRLCKGRSPSIALQAPKIEDSRGTKIFVLWRTGKTVPKWP